MLLHILDTWEGHPSVRGPRLIESLGLSLPHVLLGWAEGWCHAIATVRGRTASTSADPVHAPKHWKTM